MGDRDQDKAGPFEPLRALSAALEEIPVGVALLTWPDLTYEYANPSFRKLAPGRELLGKTNGEVFPETADVQREATASLEQAGDAWRGENVRLRPPRRPAEPMEDIYATVEAKLVEVDGRLSLLVTAFDTTPSMLLANEEAREHEEAVRRLEFLQTLDRVNEAIHSSLDYDEVMQRSLEEATNALGARAGAVFVGLDHESEARYVYGFPKSMLGRTFPAEMFPFSSLMEERKEPIPVPENEMELLMNPTLARLFGVRSMLAIPLVVRGRLMGGIGLIYRSPHDFTDAEIGFARRFGASVSLALENAELYRVQERVADTLQEALLTMPEFVPGLDFAHTYHSASEAVKVGGDFYDLFELEQDRVGITVGDISGKGLDAAVLTSLVKHAIRAQAMEKRNAPAQIVKVVNKVMFEGSAYESFATVFFAVLDCDAGDLVYCNAGHTTTALMKPGGGLELLPANSQLVGAFRRSAFRDSSASLYEGDTLFAYTDGVIEARSGDEFFGEERLMSVLAGSAGLEPRALTAHVMDAVLEFTGGRLADDVAMLAIRREAR